jgi:hypothetical protein
MVMGMRKPLLVLSLLASASPAFAQPAPPAVQLPRELTDPEAQARLAMKLQGITNALMNIRVGELGAAINGREATAAERRVTLGDVVHRKDPNFDRNVARQVAAVGPALQHGAQVLNQALPRLMHDVEDAKRALDRAVANLPDPTYPRR